MSMITAAQWVPRGFAAPFPKKYTLDESEFARIAELARLQLDDAEEDLKEAQEEEGSDGGTTIEAKYDDDDLKEYDLEHYDDDEDEAEAHADGTGMGMFGSLKALAYHGSNKDDPYITLKDDDDDDEEKEDLQILATDNLILSAKVEDELAHLEVYVFEDEGDNLYVHHDIMLPAIPLALEWLDMPVSNSGGEKGGKGNYGRSGNHGPRH
ncbi:rRNA-processing protein [Metarhizium acridum]|nr:rRNA-processing protein [Metarhizium acridum]